MRRALVLGTGKMALDAGGLLLKHGYDVTFVSHSRERADQIMKSIDKLARRVALKAGDAVHVGTTATCTYTTIPEFDWEVVFESTKEDLTVKSTALKATLPRCTGVPLVLTNSSSILPSRVGSNVAGFHVFYPAELTGFCELVAQDSYEPVSRLKEFVADLGLSAIVQNEERAFAVNRLLLPLQAYAFRLLRIGVPAKIVDSVSVCSMINIGQLSMIDSIGIDIVAAAAPQYGAMANPFEARDLEDLQLGLREILNQGKLGKKNKNGLLLGDDLTWNSQKVSDAEMRKLSVQFDFLAVNTCCLCVEYGLLSPGELNAVMKNLYDETFSLETVLEQTDCGKACSVLKEAETETGCSYFRPSTILTSVSSGRNAHVVCTAVSSINNAIRLEHEKALYEEARLFYSLAKRAADE